ncbi:MAG: nucleotidyltransferase domain-containing protein [Candidatus Margulisiibacteriota bacterium]
MRYITSKNAKLILKLLFSNTEKRYYFQEIARLVGKKAGVIQKALNNLVEEHILLDEREGNLRFFSVNKKHPLYNEIRQVIFKTVGVEGSLKDQLNKIKGIDLAFIYGSFAKNASDAFSDIDLCIVGRIKLREINGVIKMEEKALQREINYALYSLAEFKKKWKEKDPFVLDILEGALFLIGSYEKFARKA